MLRYFTYKAAALAHRVRGQVVRFTAGMGYWLLGPATPITMYDSVDPTQIPANAQAVAGYVNGKWPTYPVIVKKFPRAFHLSIAVTAAFNADVLDVEQGDATIEEAPAWVKRQHGRGVKKPVVYTSVSEAARLMETMTRAGIPRAQYALWTAHYTKKPHRCSKACGFGMLGVADATQYDDRALGRDLDASLCEPSFFGAQV